MKKIKTFLSLSLIIFALVINAQNQKTSLFNGENLEGWINHGEELWYVSDGEIICESGPKGEYGYLSTKKYYDDFILTVEFKQEANGNSGIFFSFNFRGDKNNCLASRSCHSR
jgi:hypothetical protein